MNHISPDTLQRNRGRFVALIVAMILVAVLWPGHKPWPNHLRWRSPAPGLQFGDIAQALGERPIVSRTGELTLEIWLIPWLVPGFRPIHGNQEIISFYDEQELRPLVVGQFPYGFILRGRADNPKGDPRDDSYIDIQQLGLTTLRDLHHLAVTVARDGARLYVNGRATSLALPKTIAREGVAFGGHLMLGSSNTGWRPWHGGMLGVAVYERLLGPAELLAHAKDPTRGGDALLRDPALLALYRFEEGKGTSTRSAVASGPALTFPERMTRPTRSNFLAFHRFHPGDRRWLSTDVLLNILGFVPLGFVISWKKRARVIGAALLIGFALSLSIELVQSLIPGRSSSLIDLMSNSIGALVGALLTRIGASS